MSFLVSLRRLRERWLAKTSTAGRRPRRRTVNRTIRLPLQVESLEDRTLLSTLPLPVASNQGTVQVPNPAPVGPTTIPVSGISPQIAYDPLNPQKLVAVYQTTTGGVGAAWSVDGGQSWQNTVSSGMAGSVPLLPANLRDPNTPANAPQPYAQASSPSVAFDRADNFYVAYTEHDAGNTSNAIVLQRYDFTTSTPTIARDVNNQAIARVLYQSVGLDPAYNTMVAVDNNLPTFSDVNSAGTTQTQTDKFANVSGNPNLDQVYVAWNTAYTGAGSPIKVVASDDGGNTISSERFLNANLTTPSDSSPQLVVAQGSADGTIPGGVLHAIWDNFGTNQIQHDQITDGGVGAFFNTSTDTLGHPHSGAVADATPDVVTNNTITTPSAPVSTSFYTDVNITDPNFISVSDLDVSLALVHPNLDQVSITLTPPTGSNLPTVTLVRNHVNGSNTVINANQGITGANLGVLNGVDVGTVFDQQAPRTINSGVGAAPYIAHFRPELNGISLQNAGGLTAYNNATPTIGPNGVNGRWTLTITDFFNPGGAAPVQTLDDWSLRFTSALDNSPTNGKDNTVATTTLTGAVNAPYPSKPAASPNEGVGPGAVLAIDNTLGANSPYQGRLYAAYVSAGTAVPNQAGNTDIFLVASDDGGQTWRALQDPTTGSSTIRVNNDSPSDGFSQGNRPQFLPALTVDQTTGTVVVTFNDARWDAASIRTTNYIATSIDGGNTFGPETYLNPSKTATDEITGNNVVLEPIPDNQTVAGANGFGDRQGLAVDHGRVYSIWSGNLNSAGTDLESATVSIAAGPRVVQSDMGPVDQDFHATVVDPNSGTTVTTTYNNQFAADGTREITGFVLTFDRPVDVSSLDPSEVSVIFRSPTTPGSAAGTPVAVGSITPLDGSVLFGPRQVGGNNTLATQFLVNFQTPQSQVGTYSYSVGPYVRDDIRHAEEDVLIPPAGTGGSGDVTQDVAHSSTRVNLTGNPSVVSATVNLTLRHTDDADLTITLVAPDGTRVVLISNGNGSGQNFTNTTFSDTGINGPIDAGTAPYTGSFIPEQLLTASLAGKSANGIWTLEIEDSASGDVGVLQNWSLTLTTSDATTNTFQASQLLGALMDQNGNAISEEPPLTGTDVGDVYAVPTPTSSTSFQGTAPNTFFAPPYDATTLPLIVPGPHIVTLQTDANGQITQQGTFVPGNPATIDNLVLNGAVSSVDVVFDRDMNPSTVEGAHLVSFIGPNGPLSTNVTITRDPSPGYARTINGQLTTNADPDPTHPRTYRITFATPQVLSGTYTLVLPSTLKDTSGNSLDTNENAGVDQLFDRPSAANLPTTFSNNAANAAINPGATTVSTLTVPDNFVIQGATVQLSITYPNDPDLEATLIAPDGTSVKLFTNPGGTSTNRANFSGTVLSDASATDIQDAAAPFASPPSYGPQQPLGNALDGKASGGVWQLVIKNDGTSSASHGTLTSWSLTLQKPQPQTGLGETVADQASVSFRIFTTDPNNPLSTETWTPIGPAPINSHLNADQTTAPNQNLSSYLQQGSLSSGLDTGQVTAVAVDPSDPSGNTVYAGGGSGGVWKTTNFLTTNPAGPTWVPLTSFGPTFGMNISSIAVFGRNNDPNQSIIFASTGDVWDNPIGSPKEGGVGILRSMDGGATWDLLDSATNVDAQGNPLPFNQRAHTFIGTTSLKIAVDPTDPTGTNGQGVIVYAAMSNGLWMSTDSGNHWTMKIAGDATDVTLNPTVKNTNGTLQEVFAAIEGDGVYLSTNGGNPGATFAKPPMNTVNPFVFNGDPNGVQSNQIPITNNGATPNGNNGRILLATPAATGNPVQNALYSSWVYALVISAAGNLQGLYLTKNIGSSGVTWTQVQLPFLPITSGGQVVGAIPTNDETQANYNPFANSQGNVDAALAIDPTNPNVVYIGGKSSAAQNPGLIRVDTTGINDANAFYAYDNSDNDGGKVQTATTGAIAVKTPGSPYGVWQRVFNQSTQQYTLVAPTTEEPYLNLERNPFDLFSGNSTILTHNVSSFTNDGTNAHWAPFDVLSRQLAIAALASSGTTATVITSTPHGLQTGDVVTISGASPSGYNGTYTITVTSPTTFTYTLASAETSPATATGSVGVKNILAPTRTQFNDLVTVVDPVTGTARLVIGTDMGVYTGVDDGTGQLDTGIGSNASVNGSRNGDLQLAQFAFGAVQPSIPAAELAGFFATGDDLGFPVSDPHVVSNGNLNWTGLYTLGAGVQTDPSGSGTVYEYIQPCCNTVPTLQPSDFFVAIPPGQPPVSRVGTVGQGLLQPGDNPATNTGEWQFNAGQTESNFAINPVTSGAVNSSGFSNQGIVMSSSVGRLFLTENGGVTWSVVAQPGQLDGTYVGALAFGAPLPGATDINDFIYAGTRGGKLFVTTDAGNWTDISAGLDGSAVQAISTNPIRGSHEAYAVTAQGVYHNIDSLTPQTAVSGITSSGKTATVTTAAALPASLVTGSQVTISGATGATTGYNGTYTITVTGPNTFTYQLAATQPSPAAGAIVVDGWVNITNTLFDPQLPITSLTSSGTTATATVASTATLSTGQTVTISGASPSGFNGTYAIKVTSPTTFTYTLAAPQTPTTATVPGVVNTGPVRQAFGKSYLTQPALSSLTSLAVDWRDVTSNTPATLPPIYVGGEGGVFRSIDGGSHWTIFPDASSGATGTNGSPPVGGLMPDVHVTNLSLSVGDINPSTGLPNQPGGPNMLVATTYGRGMYAIRLSNQDVNNFVSGPRIVSYTPTSPVGPTAGLSSITVTFGGPVDPSTFDGTDVTLILQPLAGGASVPITGVTVTDTTPMATGVEDLHNVYTISFPTQTRYGTYVLTVGPNVTDFMGNKMNQNGNRTNGELGAAPSGLNGGGDDRFQAGFVVTGLQVLSAVPDSSVSPPGMAAVTLTFSLPVDATTFDQSDIVLQDPTGAQVPTQDPVPAPGDTTGKVWLVRFTPQTALGNYTLTVGPNIAATDGSPMDQNLNDHLLVNGGPGTSGEIPGDQFSTVLTVSNAPPPPPVTVGGTTPGQIGFGSPAPVEITGQVSLLLGAVTPVRRHGHRVRGRFTQTVTVFNNSNNVIAGPIALVLANLGPFKTAHHRRVSRVTLLNANGTTQRVAAGSPFVFDVVQAGQLRSFSGLTFDLEYKTDGTSLVFFTPIILANSAQP